MTVQRDWFALKLLGATWVFCALGCSSRNNGGGDSAVTVDADAATAISCPTPGTNFCHLGGYYQCDPSGHGVLQQLCGGLNPACIDTIGCRPCQGGSLRCDPSSPNTPQTCRADHSGYDSQSACPADGSRVCYNGQCQTPCEIAAASNSYLGCDYWPVTTKNTCLAELGGTFPFSVAIANPQTTAVQATVTGGGLPAPVMQTIAPGMLVTIDLPFVDDLAQLRVRPGTSVLRPGGAYHLTTSLPVTVYQFNPLTFQSGTNYSYSNDASLLLPTSVLGADYTALTWPGITFQIGNTPPWDSGGTVTVVGTNPSSTQVTVTLAGTIVAGTNVSAGVAGDHQTFTLAQGDVLQLLGGGEGTDLSGTTIHSSSPVAVYAGHGCAQVPVDRAAGNHLEEQLFPDATWGRRYAVSAFVDRPSTASSVRIIAQRDGTHLTFDPPSVHTESVTLGAHQFIQVDTMVDFMVSADKPILVAQFMYGEGNDSTEGDPAMVYEVPVEQYRNDYTFLAPTTYSHSYVNIVTQGTSAPLLDGTAVTVGPRTIGGSGFVSWSLQIQPGVHHVATSSSSAFCGIKVYGTAPYTAYAYPGGLDLQTIVPQ